MKHLLFATTIGLLALSPGLAAAQSAEPPRFEIGAQVSGQTSERSAVTWTPRLTVNFRPDSALELSTDIRQRERDPFRQKESGQTVSIHLRQTLWEDGRWQVSGVVGGGVRRSTIVFPGNNPESKFVQYDTDAHLGPTVQLQVARRLMLRADVRLEFSDQTGFRGMIGAAVPLGQMPAGSRARQRPADSLVNGTAIGASVGAVTGALAGAFLAAIFCEDDCTAGGLAFVSATTAGGTAMGGLLGAIIDAFKR